MQEMASRLRGRLTYANVVATIALFIAVGGASAFAATQLKKNSVGTKQIKAKAVTTAKIKRSAVTTAKNKNAAVTGAKVANDTLTGSNINLDTLGTVPSANIANSVNGQTPTKIFKTLLPGESNALVMTVSGFSITASCEAENADVTLTSPSSAGSVLIAAGSGKNKGTTNNIFDYAAENAGTASSLRLDESEGGGAENRYGESAFSGTTSTGAVISGELGYDYKTFNGEAPERCVVFGQAISG
jgi:hypothetical protein